MEISFTEFDELKEEEGVVVVGGEEEQGNYQYNNYWTNENNTASSTNTKSKKKVSYDDILSSLNMVVHKGVLQFAKPVAAAAAPKQQQQQQQQWQQQQTSYIHNKYFQPQQQQEEPRRPMTREEYIRDYNARIISQRRIAQIKSKKLLFDTQHINVSPSQNPRDMNKLFATRFRM